jgi:3-oxoacyl-[acyl-carrier protein] reductase
MAFSLTDRVALVTGAGRGMGAAIAKRFASAGPIVYLADLSERAAAVAQTIHADREGMRAS